jgi:hypothetical protein
LFPSVRNSLISAALGALGAVACALLLAVLPAAAGAQAATATTLGVTAAGSAVTTVNAGAVVTLTASVTAGTTPVTVGRVNFCDATVTYCTDIHLLATAQLTAAGTATFRFKPGVGSHTYKAVFAGTKSNATSSSTASALSVTYPGLIPSVSSIAQSGAVGNYTLTATVGGGGSSAPTGTVNFIDRNNSNAVLGTAALGAAISGPDFLLAPDTQTGQSATTPVVADFNGDGIPDLVMTFESGSGSTGPIQVLLGNGDGTFQPPLATSVSNLYPTSIAVGDFNGDGIPDLAVSSSYVNYNDQYEEYVIILLGKGDGTFTTGTSFNLTAEDFYLAVADFNGDGNADLAILSYSTDDILIVLGNGDGTFSESKTTPINTWLVSMAIGDFNGDGIPDLAVTNYYDDNVSILLGNGDGSFTTGASLPTGGGPVGISVGDFRGNGILDLALANDDTNDITILLGHGDGTFSKAAASPKTDFYPDETLVGDFNGDGIPDLAVGTSCGTDPSCKSHGNGQIFLGNGDGTFTPSTATPSSAISNVIVPGDFNGDGIPDLALFDLNLGTFAVLLTEPQAAAATVTSVAVLPIGSGTHQIVASYQGDSHFTASTSPSTILNTASPTATISVTSSLNPAPYGTPVDFTATLTGNGVTPPSGGVSFLDGNNSIAGVALSGAVATYSTSGLATGLHSITVTYSGDGYYGKLTSTELRQAVVPAADNLSSTTLAVISAGAPVTTVPFGTTVTLTATVQVSGAPATAGTVNFCDATATYCTDIHLLGTAQLTSSGSASIRLFPAIGSHSYVAVFAGTNSAGISASAPSSLSVTGLYSTAAGISESGSVGHYSLNVFMGGEGPAPPTGTVSFVDTSNANALLGTSALSGGASALSFVNVSNPAEGTNPASVVAGDFNGDGIPDLAMANYNGNNITVLLGDGTGNFAPTAASPATGNNPIALAAGDFNGDGKLDLAVANYKDGTVTILLGDGTGNFAPTASSPATGINPDAVAVGDFNGDGKLDLAVANYGSNTVTVLLGDGKGNFTAAATSPATGNEPSSIVSGDFNGDGIPDLAVTNYRDSTVTVLLGNGDGTFTPAPGALPATGAEPNSIVTADFNRDGKLDLAVANFTGESVTVLLGNGDGTFAAAASQATGNGPYSVAVGDFNGDGILDLATTNYDDNTITVLLGDGTGNFTAVAQTALPAVGNNPISAAAGNLNGAGLSGLAIANYNSGTMTVILGSYFRTATAAASGISVSGAGPHLVQATYAGDVNYAAGNLGSTSLNGLAASTTTLALTSAGSPVTTVTQGSIVTLTASVQVGGVPVTTGQVRFCDATVAYCTDVHRFGNAQLTDSGTAAIKLIPALGSHSYKAVFAGITGGAAGFSAVSSSGAVPLTVSGIAPSTTAIAESGNPGNYTLTATVSGQGSAPPTGTVSFLDTSDSNAVIGTGTLSAGTAGLSFLNSSNPATGQTPDAVVAGDFNGDGILDLAVANQGSNNLSILLGNGDGTFHPTASSVPAVPAPYALASADFNGDGILDLAVIEGGNDPVMVLLGKGDGTFTAKPGSTTGVGPDALAVADFNGDGIPDLAVVNNGGFTYGCTSCPGTVTILLGNGDGTFTAAPMSPSTGLDPFAIVTGDFNGDGIPDLAVLTQCGAYPDCQSGQAVTILLGNGDGTFNLAPTGYQVGGLDVESIAVGDFNGDGNLDLVLTSSYNDIAAVFAGHGDGTFTSETSTPTGTNPEAIAVGDFNGDGIADLAVANSGSNSLSILLGNGDGSFTAASATPSMGSGAAFMAVGDFNGDGIADLAVINENSTAATILVSESQSATATVTGISPPGTGTHLIDASYPGDSNYNSSASGTVGLTAELLPPRMTLTSSSSSVKAGVQVTLTATVTAAAAPPKDKGAPNPHAMATPPVPTGTMTFYLGETTLGAISLNSQGEALFATSALPAGTDSITASYSGDKNYASATAAAVIVTVIPKLAPTLKLTALAGSITYGASETLTATVTGTGATPTGAVTFLQGATALGTSALNGNGMAALVTSKLPTGNDSITASYVGDANYGGAVSQAVEVTVSKATPAVRLAASSTSAAFGATVTLTATLTGAGANPTGLVTFVDGAVTLGSGMLDAAGIATLATSKLQTGKDSVTASYAGDANYLAATSSAVTVTIGPKPVPLVTLTPSQSTIEYGKPVTLAAALAHSGAMPSGTVTFFNGKASLGAAAIDSSGVAAYTASLLPGGKNSISAAYSGDANYSPVTSAVAIVTVTRVAPAVKLAASSSSPIYGRVVTMTAALTGAGIKPTGTITFFEGTTSVGTGALGSGGIAAIETTRLPAGKDTIAATYSGDTNYNPASSPPIVVTVAKATLTVTANSLSKVYGAPLPALTYSLTSFLNGDTASSATKGAPRLATTATAKSPVGSYPVTFAGDTLTAANYVFRQVPGTLAVTKAMLTVTASNASVVYNQPLPKLTYTVSGYVNGDTSSVLKGFPAETTTAAKGSLPGTYPIAIARGTLTVTGNYSFAFKDGTLTIEPIGTAATPAFSPRAGTYTTAQSVTISDTTPGAAIHYTIDGTAPLATSTKYAGAIGVSATETIKAIAVATGYANSAISSQTYTIAGK